jgi:O-antigen/teichoic acid export membrane protein
MSVIKRNLGWLLFSQGATWAVSVTVLIIVPREIGDQAFGRLTFAQIYVGLFEFITLFGSGTYLAKTLSRDAASVGRYVVNTLVLKIFLTFVVIVFALGLATALGYEEQTILLIAIFCLGLLFSTLNSVLMGGLQGLQRMARPALWELIRSVVAATIGLGILLNGGGIVAYALVFNVARVIPVVANLAMLWPDVRRSIQLEFALWKEVMIGGFPFFVTSAFTLIYAMIDVPLIEALAGEETVGWYGLANLWIAAPIFFASMVSYAYFPALSAEAIGDPDAFARLANRAITITLLVAAPAALGIALIAEDFISLLYGTEFQQAAPIMQIAALNIPLVSLDLMLGTVVIAVDRQRQWVILGVIAAVLNPLLNLFAIPFTHRVFDNGALGAAAITVLTELFIFVGALRLRPASVLDRATVSTVLRIGVASASMVPVVLVLGSSPLIVQIFAGALTYLGVSRALGTISMRDIRSIGAESLSRQPRTSVAP